MFRNAMYSFHIMKINIRMAHNISSRLELVTCDLVALVIKGIRITGCYSSQIIAFPWSVMFVNLSLTSVLTPEESQRLPPMGVFREKPKPRKVDDEYENVSKSNVVLIPSYSERKHPLSEPYVDIPDDLVTPKDAGIIFIIRLID